MSKEWKHLRGAQLSAYATSVQASDQWHDFVKHLAKHGNEQDFHNFINGSFQPLLKCLEVFDSHPAAAFLWVQQYVEQQTRQSNNPKEISATHYAIASFACENPDGFSTVSSNEILNLVDWRAMDPIKQKFLIKDLVANRWSHVIEQNWEMYKPIFEKMMPIDCQQHVMFCAHFGFDLHARINWRPSTPLQSKDLFIACCVGGLLNSIQDLHFPEHRHNVIIKAFEKTASDLEMGTSAQNIQNVLNYLWEAYPNTPWHRSSNLLPVLTAADPLLMQKVIDHVHINEPTKLTSLAHKIALEAIDKKSTALFKAIAPHLLSEHHSEIIIASVNARQTAMVKQLLNKPGIADVFHTTVQTCKPKSQEWAQNLYNTLQRSVLHKTTKSAGANHAKRKM